MTASSFGSRREPQYANADAPDPAVNPTEVAAYAAKNGNRRIDNVAQRNAAIGTSDVWDGLEWQDTDGDRRTWLYLSGAWVQTGTRWIEFVPSMSGLTNATVMYAKYKVSDMECSVRIGYVLAASPTVNDPTLSFPLPVATWLSNLAPLGTVTFYDQSAGTNGRYPGTVYKTASGARLLAMQVVGTTATLRSDVIAGSTPMIAAQFDEYHAQFTYPLI